jgi:hypothetical protein
MDDKKEIVKRRNKKLKEYKDIANGKLKELYKKAKEKREQSICRLKKIQKPNVDIIPKKDEDYKKIYKKDEFLEEYKEIMLGKKLLKREDES